jgi:hypothetical protein
MSINEYHNIEKICGLRVGTIVAFNKVKRRGRNE